MTLDEAKGVFGTKAAIAAALGLSKASVTKWGETIPFGWQCQLEVITDGRLRADRPRDSEAA